MHMMIISKFFQFPNDFNELTKIKKYSNICKYFKYNPISEHLGTEKLKKLFPNIETIYEYDEIYKNNFSSITNIAIYNLNNEFDLNEYYIYKALIYTYHERVINFKDIDDKFNCCCHDCKDCAYCYNCDKCYDCNDCNDCNNCTSCKYCNNCYECDKCLNCNDCSICDECLNCKCCGKCDNCENCKCCGKCADCRYSDKCNNCKACRCCRDCKRCNKCENCKYCYNCENCMRYIGYGVCEY